jgi:hypothetical protein
MVIPKLAAIRAIFAPTIVTAIVQFISIKSPDCV